MAGEARPGSGWRRPTDAPWTRCTPAAASWRTRSSSGEGRCRHRSANSRSGRPPPAPPGRRPARRATARPASRPRSPPGSPAPASRAPPPPRKVCSPKPAGKMVGVLLGNTWPPRIATSRREIPPAPPSPPAAQALGAGPRTEERGCLSPVQSFELRQQLVDRLRALHDVEMHRGQRRGRSGSWAWMRAHSMPICCTSASFFAVSTSSASAAGSSQWKVRGMFRRCRCG